MSLHINQPIYRSRQAPVQLPAAVLGALLERAQPEKFSSEHLPLARAMRDALSAKGLKPKDLLPLLDQGKNHGKTLSQIEDALNGVHVHEQFLACLLKVLDIHGDALEAIQAQDLIFQRERWKDSVRRQAHNAYRRFGPHLYPMPLTGWRPSLLGMTGDGHFYTPIEFQIVGDDLLTPDFEAITKLIRNPPADAYFARPGCFGAILYHRYPEEMAFFDMEGRLISQGNCLLAYPEGVKRFMF